VLLVYINFLIIDKHDYAALKFSDVWAEPTALLAQISVLEFDFAYEIGAASLVVFLINTCTTPVLNYNDKNILTG